MDLIVFVIIVLICLALILWAIEQIPMNPPINWVMRVLVILLAVLFIIRKAGLG
jgi:hypothetical protein